MIHSVRIRTYFLEEWNFKADLENELQFSGDLQEKETPDTAKDYANTRRLKKKKRLKVSSMV